MIEEKKKKNNYIAVVGGVNVDICGTPHKPLVDCDSNPGTVKTSIGGVGRNIAHNLRLLDKDVMLITAVGDDAEAERIAESCKELGIDLSYSLIVPNTMSSRYMFITDENGEMRLAVNDMSIYENITIEFINTRLDVINGAGICIADTNIPRDSLEYLADNCSVPLFVDPVSVAKSYKISKIIGKLHTLKPNIMEAEVLADIAVRDETSLIEAANKLLSSGLERVFITMGKNGVFYADGSGSGTLSCVSGSIVNTTGAGDSFMAAAAWAYLGGLSLYDTARAGLAASAICLESSDAVNKHFSRELLISRSVVNI